MADSDSDSVFKSTRPAVPGGAEAKAAAAEPEPEPEDGIRRRDRRDCRMMPRISMRDFEPDPALIAKHLFGKP